MIHGMEGRSTVFRWEAACISSRTLLVVREARTFMDTVTRIGKKA